MGEGADKEVAVRDRCGRLVRFLRQDDFSHPLHTLEEFEGGKDLVNELQPRCKVEQILPQNDDR